MRYKPTDLSFWDSTAVSLIPADGRPSFAGDLNKFPRLAYVPYPTVLPSSSTGIERLGYVVVERFDPKDDPDCWNYNRHEFGLTSTGGTVLGPPQRTAAIKHHLSEPSTWLDSLDYLEPWRLGRASGFGSTAATSCSLTSASS